MASAQSVPKYKEQIRSQIDKAVDTMTDEIFRKIQELVKIPSVVGNEGEAQEWIAEHYHSLGLDVIRLVPKKENLINHPAYGESGFPYDDSRPNIIGVLPGTGNGKSLILNGHVDVVSPEPIDTWEQGGPWSGVIEGNRLYGRGAADMKSGLVANYYALKTVVDHGYIPKGKVILESVIEEEAGGSGGTLAAFLAGYSADAMIIPEPFNLKIITSHTGVIIFRVKVYGKTTHACFSHKGVNAIGKLMKIYARLVKLDEERAQRNRNDFFEKSTGRSCNLNIGRFQSGDWASTVPGSAEMDARVSYLPGETVEIVKKEIMQAIGEVVARDNWLIEHPPQIEWLRWRARPWEQDPEIPLIRRFYQTVSEVLLEQPIIAASTTGLDTRIGAFFGVPALVFGPVGENYHCSNEYVELDSVIKTIKVLAAFIIDWCGVE